MVSRNMHRRAVREGRAHSEECAKLDAARAFDAERAEEAHARAFAGGGSQDRGARPRPEWEGSGPDR